MPMTAPAIPSDRISRKRRSWVAPGCEVVISMPLVFALGSQSFAWRAGSKTLPMNSPPIHVRFEMLFPENRMSRAWSGSFLGRMKRAPWAKTVVLDDRGIGLVPSR